MKSSFISSLTLSAIAIVFALPAFAGSSDVQVNCRSASGLTVINASVPGDDEEASLILTVAGSRATYISSAVVDDYSANNQDINSAFPGYAIENISVVENHALKIYTISVNDGATNLLQLVAIPASLNLTKTAAGLKGTFSALLSGNNPDTKGPSFNKLPMSCTYDYEN